MDVTVDIYISNNITLNKLESVKINGNFTGFCRPENSKIFKLK